MNATDRCLHCPNLSRDGGARGLCARCWKNVAIRALYPPIASDEFVRRVAEGTALARHETEADLDAMIAEMRSTMPPAAKPKLRPKQGAIRVVKRGNRR